MGLINLPSLVQKIKVDTSDMKKAEADATKFGTSLKASNKEAEESFAGLKKSQKDFTDSSAKMSEEVKTSTKSFVENTKAFQENEKAKQRGKRSNNDAGSAFADFTKRVDAQGKAFGNLNFSMKDLKIPLIAAGAGAGVGAFAALTAATGALVAQFGPMVGVLGAYAPAMLAVKTSTKLFGDTLKEITDKKTGDKVASDLLQVQKAGVEAFKPQLIAAIKAFAPALKLVSNGYKELGQALGNRALDNAEQLAGNTVFMKNLGVVLENNATLAETFVDALQPLARIFVNITKAAGPMAQHFAEDFVLGAESVANMSDNTSKLEGFFDKAEKTARRFVGSMVDIGKAIKNTFAIGAKSIGIDFVGGLESGAAKMKEFTQSVEGQNKIAKFFADAGPIIKETGLLIRDVLKEIVGLGDNQSIAEFLKILRTETLPAVSDLANGVGGNLLPTVGHLATAFAEFNSTLSFSPLITVVDGMAKLATAAANVVQAVPGLGSLVATLLLIKTSSKGLAIASNFSGITGLVKSFKEAGAAGTAGAKGMAGFIQGLKGATGESATLTNKIGSGLRTAFTSGVEGVKGLGTKIKDGLKAGVDAVTALPGKTKEAVSALGTRLKGAAASAATGMKTLATNAKLAAAAMLSNVKAGVAAAASGLKTMAVNAWNAAKALAASAAAGVRAAFASLASALAPMISGLKGAALAAKAFTVSLLTNPIFLIITAVIALGAALVLLYKKNETFRNFVNAAWAGIKAVISATVDWVVNTAWPWLKNAWDNIANGAKALWVGLKATWAGIKEAVSTAISAVVDFVKSHWGLLLGLIIGPFGPILQLIVDNWGKIKAAFSAAWDAIKSVVSTAWTNVTTLISTGWNTIKTAFTSAFDFLKGIVSTAWTAIKTLFSSAFTIVWTQIKTTWELIKTVFSTALAVVKALLTGNFGAIPGIVKGGMDKAKTILGDAWEAIKKAAGTGITAMITLVKDIPQKIISALGNVSNMLYDAGRKIVQGLINGISNMIGALRSKVSELTGVISSHLPGSPVKEGPLRVLNRGYAGGQIVKMLQEGLDKAPKLQIPGVNRLVPKEVTSAIGAASLPRPSSMAARANPTQNVDNSRKYYVTINETTGPSTAASLTNRLRLLDVAL